MSKKIYICGKVSGLDPQYVTAKFGAAQWSLEKLGYTVVNPVTLVGDVKATWLHAMKLCIPALLDCDAIYIQDDWHTSRGARIEIATAAGMGLQMLMEDWTHTQQLHAFVRLMSLLRYDVPHMDTTSDFKDFM